MRTGFHFIRDIVTHPVICIVMSVYISDADSVASWDSATISCFNPVPIILLEKSNLTPAVFKNIQHNIWF